MQKSIFDLWKSEMPEFDRRLKSLFQKDFFENDLLSFEVSSKDTTGSKVLSEAIQYALFTGGKRFRPLLTYASCKVLEKDFKEAMVWAMAIECIHTYSLIHDDLPCMDDDDERRGQPTVHKKFNEATALLAGDALLTEAFGLIAEYYNQSSNLGRMIKILSDRSGFQGMISGQANDLSLQASSSEEELLLIHLQKTAALISAACLGPFLIFNQNEDVIKPFDRLSLILGLLFQLKDDFLDANNKEETNLVQSHGHKKTEAIYLKYKSEAEKLIANLSQTFQLKPYIDLIEYNDSREY